MILLMMLSVILLSMLMILLFILSAIRHLTELDWSFVTENNDINLSFETFLHFINIILDKHTPIKTMKKNRKQNNI